MYTKLYAISGMSCANCASRVREALEGLPGVAGVQVLLESAQAVVRTKMEISITSLNAALDEAGHYHARETNEAAAIEQKRNAPPALLRFFRRKKSCCQ